MSSNVSKSFLSKKRVLVTGAAGSIGSALCRRLSKLGAKLLLLDQDETGIFDLCLELEGEPLIANIRDAERIEQIFKQYKPDIVFHAAAYKHVAMMDRFPEEARKTNIGGLENVLKSALANGVQKFIFISSDKAVNAKCVMGKSKAVGEKMCLAHKECIVVRFGNVMPSRGSVVPIFQKQIDEGKDLTVTSKDMKRYFMGIYDAANLVIRAAEIGKGGEIFILDMGEELYISDLARMMIKLSGKDLNIIYTKPNSGEKYNEELMTKDEKKRAIKLKDLYVIRPKN